MFACSLVIKVARACGRTWVQIPPTTLHIFTFYFSARLSKFSSSGPVYTLSQDQIKAKPKLYGTLIKVLGSKLVGITKNVTLLNQIFWYF